MALQIGYKNGQKVVYDPSDPLSSYGVTPMNTITAPPIVGTISQPIGGTIEEKVAQQAFKESQETGKPAEVSGTMQAIGTEPYTYGVSTSSALAENIKTRYYKTVNGIKTEISKEEYERMQTQPAATSTSTTTEWGGGKPSGKGATGTWMGSKTMESFYDPETGIMTQKKIMGGKEIWDKSLFYGYSSQQIGGSMTTATATEQKQILPPIDTKSFFPKYSEKGVSAAPILFLTGAAMTIPSFVSTGWEVLKTPGEILAFGPGVVTAKISKAGKDIFTSWTTQPLESATMLAGSAAFSYGLGKLYHFIKTDTIESVGQAKIEIKSTEKDITRASGEANIRAPELKTDVMADYDIVMKDLGGKTTASVQRGELVALTERKWLSKIAGKKVVTKRDTAFGEFGLTTPITDLHKAGGSVTATGLKDVKITGEISKLQLESPKLDIWVSALKSKGQRTLIRTDILKPSVTTETGGGLGNVFLSSIKTKPFVDISLDVAKQTQNVLKTVSTSKITPFIPVPVIFKTDVKTAQKQKTAGLTITQFKKEMKTAPISATTSAVVSLQKESLKPINLQMTMPSTKTEQKLLSSQLTMPLVATKQKQVEIGLTMQGLKTETTMPFSPSPPTPPPPTHIGGFTFGFPKGTGRSKKSKFKISGKQRLRYTPSVGGILLGRKAKKPPKKIFTGFEIRPFILKSRRRKRR